MQMINHLLKGICWGSIFLSVHASAVMDASFQEPKTRLVRTLDAVDESFQALHDYIVTPEELSAPLSLPNDLPSSPESEQHKVIAQLNTSLATRATAWRNSSQTERPSSGITALTYDTDRRTFSREYTQEDLHIIFPKFPPKELSQCTLSDLFGIGTTLIDPLRIRSISLPNNLSSWPTGVLSACKYLVRISAYGPTDTASLTLTKEHNLGPLHRLESFEIPAAVKELSDANLSRADSERVIPINVKSLLFPTTITTIGSNIAYECTNLTTVSLANCTALTSISGGAFKYCSALTSIDVSGCTSLTSIGNAAFWHCSNLIMFDATNTKLTSIVSYAFYGTQLACVILPTTFTAANSIGYCAFPSTLKSLIWKGSAAPSTSVFHSGAFDGSSYSTAVSNGLKVTTVS